MKNILLTLLGLFALSSLALAQEKPNILFLFSDDQRADAVGAYGNRYIETPNLDRLANQGTKFTNNFCMGSHHGAVCAPSRAMLMSGKSLFRVYDDLEGVTTMPMVLGENGYETFGTGKWHNGEGPFKAAFQKGKNIFFGGMSDHFEVPIKDLKEDGTYTEQRTDGYSSELFTDATLEFLQEYAESEREKPFFAYVSFTTPHDPRSPIADYINYYGETSLPLPENYSDKHPFDIGVMTIRDENLGEWPRSAAQVRRQLADYYAMITHMDQQIGKMLNFLEQEGLMENTLIIFSSDHGLAIGSHGLLGKQSLYEHSMKSPLIIKGPGIPANQTSDALLYLYDIFPTLCTYLDIETPEGVEGKSFLPVIRQEKRGVRESLFTTYAKFQRAVKDHRWKLIQYPELHYTQLFDLENDPYELNNLAYETAYAGKVEEMTELLKEWQKASGDTLPLNAADKKPMEYDLSDYDRKPDRWQPEYTLKKYFGKE